ncbi:dihydrolipoyl dehydrogenase [Cryptosporangium sp. NPDC048952]|uniref:dihydrolipoyl dehydrogenase n=1 Tax=Cryptosporangium sp. NPDC048952 TaxID=3363961 RepID=UPI00372061E7
MPTHYDVVVLGAGPGGYVAAIRAAQLGQKVAIVEEKYWGGVCLNIGCIPSKALLRNAELADLLTNRAKSFGITGDITVDYGTAFDRSRDVADGRVKGVHYLMKKNGITEYEARGVFTGPHEIRVDDDLLTFDSAIIATGSRVRSLPAVEPSPNVVTYAEQILERDLPRSIAIIGAGAIGMEFAYLLRAFGVDVTLLEYFDRVLPNEDTDVSAEMAKAYRKLGITVRTSARVESATDHGENVTVRCTDRDGPSELTVDRVLVSVGFAPNVEGFGLESTGVRLSDQGAIDVDVRMRTSVPHLFAIGDVTMKLQLAHVAEAQAVVAAETIAGAPTVELGDYRMMPRATFSHPQVASFGLTEEQARATGRAVTVAKFPFTANGKAHGLGEPVGFVKLIAETEYGELLGGHLVGPEVAELLPELTLAQRWELGVPELVRNVHTHPTLSEALQEAFHGLAGHTINL